VELRRSLRGAKAFFRTTYVDASWERINLGRDSFDWARQIKLIEVPGARVFALAIVSRDPTRISTRSFMRRHRVPASNREPMGAHYTAFSDYPGIPAFSADFCRFMALRKPQNPGLLRYGPVAVGYPKICVASIWLI